MKRTSEGDISATPDEGVDINPAGPKRSRWGWWLGGLAIVAVGAVAAVTLLSDGAGSDSANETVALTFDEVVQTDLIQMDSFDGTLGTDDGDPVTSPAQGTVTSTAAVGTMIEQGDVFLTVDNEPVVLLYGELPAYRDLTATEDSMSLGGNVSGVVTEVVAAGETIQQGDVLYRTDGEPVVVMYGDIPAYRTLRDLSDNMTGTDVLQLETALVDLGYDPDGLATVDEEFTDYTETMVERWQEDLGVEEDGQVSLGDVIFIPAEAEVLAVAVEVGQSVAPGQAIATISTGDALQGADLLQLEQALAALGYDPGTVDGAWDSSTKSAVVAWQTDNGVEADGAVNLGEVVFLPSMVQVNDVLVSIGSAVNAGTPVLGISSADKFVTFDLPAADQGLLAVGQEVVIEMPDGSDAAGTVLSVASVASGGQGEATFEVKIVLVDPSVAIGLDEAPVDVEVVSDSVSNVMAVPVSALVALAEGGYAVEVNTGSGTQLVAVEPGFYADGLVEVESSGLNVGDMVVVP
ncbi:MAG: HlyD family efflux transporter periplasmic adaptor subunit [bacterium]|nr:HlyD family efflux transporter periplasmic adaptor subunit [bacterium]